MSYEEAAMAELIRGPLIEGVKAGRLDSLAEAPYVKDTLGINPDINTLRYVPTEVGPLPSGVSGVTHITPDGKAVGVRISSYLASLGMHIARKYRKSLDWAKNFIYELARDVTNHEDYHVLSAPLARGEEITDSARDLMESITTRGRYKVAKRLGKEKKAKFIEATNPYPRAWKMAEIADWAPYVGPSGEGYKGFLADASKESFYKPLGRLSWQATKAAVRKGRDYIRGTSVPAYVPKMA